MDKELVIIVPNEETAYQVVRRLKALDDERSIELYLANVITKTAAGVKRVEESRHIHPPLSAALGATTGASIGFLGGPVGAAIGAAIGGAVGLGGGRHLRPTLTAARRSDDRGSAASCRLGGFGISVVAGISRRCVHRG